MNARSFTSQIGSVALVAMVFAHLGATRWDVYGQSSGGKAPLISRTSIKAPTGSVEKNDSKPILFSRAAAENTRLRDALQWPFGGKVQTGWSIYTALIGHTIGSNSRADSPEFARAAAAWQSRSALPANGIIDEATLNALVKYWQSQRRYSSEYPEPERLISAPISDFYDPTRSPELLQLERDTYGAYVRMVAAAAKDLSKDLHLTKNGQLAPDEKFLRIISAFRSREYQEELRRRSPNSGRGALAKFSAHSTGQALDIYVGGEPVSTRDANRLLQVNTAAYKWLVKNAHRYGFVPYFYEPWHWEYVGLKNSN